MSGGLARPQGTMLPAWGVVLAGVVAALHVGKLPPALQALHEALNITLIQAGFLLSLVQLAGMTLGLTVGLAADGLGLKRSMLTGLLILGVASALGGWANDAPTLLLLRAVESLGFLLVCLPGPSLIRHLVPPHRISTLLGLWGTYMPLGMATALLLGPLFISWGGWQLWWRVLAGLTLGMVFLLWRLVPADPMRRNSDNTNLPHPEDTVAWPQRLRQTLGSRGPWLVALSFAVYSGQWLAVVGFLPTVYAQAGVSGGLTAVLTALVAAINMAGNIASGRLLDRGVQARVLLSVGFAVMALGTLAAFASFPLTPQGTGLPPSIRFTAVLFFSMVGGLIPGTLFSLAVRLSPTVDTVSTTVGWVQQWSALGQFVGPPLVAGLASRVGGWHWTWGVTGLCCVLGLLLAWQIGKTEEVEKP
jgi:MFS transporter, CP family, cyanate transporter